MSGAAAAPAGSAAARFAMGALTAAGSCLSPVRAYAVAPATPASATTVQAPAANATVRRIPLPHKTHTVTIRFACV
ncbi:hypothetical protein GCM10023170_052200 [Phytohabitans houttuyneae]